MATIAETLADRPDYDPEPEDEGCEMVMDISAETRDFLAHLAFDSGGSEFDVIGKALALYRVTLDASREGKRIGIFDENGDLEREIVGL